MKKAFLSVIYFITVTVCLSNSLYSQSLEISRTCIDSLLIDKPLDKKDKILGHNLWNIYRFNKVKKVLNDADTIILVKENGRYFGQYKSHKFPLNKEGWTTKNPLFLDGSKNTDWEHFTTQFSESDSVRTQISITNPKPFVDDPLMIIKHYIDGVPYGEYLQRTMSGKTIRYGRYNLIDSVYIDSMIIIDFHTYEEKYIITNRNYASTKCGDWTEYHINGEVAKVNTYIDCEIEEKFDFWYIVAGSIFLLFLILVYRIFK